MIRILAMGVLLSVLATPAATHDAADGTPCHMGPYPMSSGTVAEQWHCHVTAEEKERKRRAVHEAKRHSRSCKKAKKHLEQARNPKISRHEQRERDGAALYCADTSKRGHAELCKRSRAKLAGFDRSRRGNLAHWQKEVVERCGIGPLPKAKSREQRQCEQLARVIEGERSRRNAKGVAYWRQRASEAGCVGRKL